MDPVLSYLTALTRVLRDRLSDLREDGERGSITLEEVVVASVLFLAAVALVAVIVAVIKGYQGKITAPGG